MFEYQQAGLSDPDPNTCSSLCILDEAIRQDFHKTPTLHKLIQYDKLLPVALSPDKIIPHTFSCDVIYVAAYLQTGKLRCFKGRLVIVTANFVD